MLTFEQWLKLFPSLFAIVLCVLSRFDHLWISAKVRMDMADGSPTPAMVINVQQIANGAASLNVHIINVLLFIAGVLCAVFEWPRCLSAVPIFVCILLIVLAVIDVIVTAITVPLAHFERDAPPANNTNGDGRGWWSRRPGDRLRGEQILLNVTVLVLIGIGLALGGGDDVNGRCPAAAPHGNSTAIQAR